VADPYGLVRASLAVDAPATRLGSYRGGVGYVLSAFVVYFAPDAGIVADALTFPATVGEFWMIGYLLVRGVNRRALGQ
jgi:Domain of unknown function (DUF4386)